MKLFPRWRKQNEQIQNINLAMAMVIATVVGLQLEPLGLGQMSAIAIIVAFVLRFLLDIVLKNMFPRSMFAVLNFNFEQLAIDFERLFKERAISFYGSAEEESHRFEFPEHKLLLDVEPHLIRRPNKKPLTVAKATMHPLSPTNQAFALGLTEAIDEIVTQEENQSDNPTS